MIVNWNAVAAVATAVAAGVTAWMACLTRKMIQQSKQNNQDSFRPVCILENHYGPDDPYWRENYLKVKLIDTNDLLLSIHCRLHNIGIGPALKLMMKIYFPYNTGIPFPSELQPLAAKDSYGDINTPLNIRMSNLNYRDHEFGFKLPFPGSQEIINSPWVIVLEYEDVFGNKFFTVHTRNAEQPWVETGKGNGPTFSPVEKT